MVNTPNNIPKNYNAASKKAQDNVDLFSSLLFDNHQSIKIFTAGDIFTTTQCVPLKDNFHDQNFFLEGKYFSRRLATPSLRDILWSQSTVTVKVVLRGITLLCWQPDPVYQLSNWWFVRLQRCWMLILFCKLLELAVLYPRAILSSCSVQAHFMSKHHINFGFQYDFKIVHVEMLCSGQIFFISLKCPLLVVNKRALFNGTIQHI